MKQFPSSYKTVSPYTYETVPGSGSWSIEKPDQTINCEMIIGAFFSRDLDQGVILVGIRIKLDFRLRCGSIHDRNWKKVKHKFEKVYNTKILTCRIRLPYGSEYESGYLMHLCCQFRGCGRSYQWWCLEQCRHVAHVRYNMLSIFLSCPSEFWRSNHLLLGRKKYFSLSLYFFNWTWTRWNS